VLRLLSENLSATTLGGMCRSIRRLRQGSDVAGQEEVREAALQYVRKVSGFSRPADRHAGAFDAAVDEVAAASQRLLESISETLPAGRRLAG
jgi:hypothetical protein